MKINDHMKQLKQLFINEFIANREPISNSTLKRRIEQLQLTERVKDVRGSIPESRNTALRR